MNALSKATLTGNNPGGNAFRQVAIIFRMALEVAAILLTIGFYMAVVQSNRERISALEQAYQRLAPLSQTEKAVDDQRYEEIQRQLRQIQESIQELQRRR